MRFITCFMFLLLGYGCGSLSQTQCEQYAAVAKTTALNMCVGAIKEISDEATQDESESL